MSDEMKPCPFCGASGATSIGVYHNENFSWAYCDACETEGPTVEGGKAEAIAAWNRRAQSEADTARIAQLEESLRFYTQPESWRARGLYMSGRTPTSEEGL